MNLEASPYRIILPRCLQLFGMGILFVPLNTAAYIYVPPHQTSNASGLFNLLRNEGDSFGIAVETTMLDRRSKLHQLRLVEHLHAAKPHVSDTLDVLGARLGTRHGDRFGSASESGAMVH